MSKDRYDFGRPIRMASRKKKNGVQEPDRGHGVTDTAHRLSNVPGANGATQRMKVEKIRNMATQSAEVAFVHEHQLMTNLIQALRENTDTIREINGLTAIARDYNNALDVDALGEQDGQQKD